jgi:hypothetical protein
LLSFQNCLLATCGETESSERRLSRLLYFPSLLPPAGRFYCWVGCKNFETRGRVLGSLSSSPPVHSQCSVCPLLLPHALWGYPRLGCLLVLGAQTGGSGTSGKLPGSQTTKLLLNPAAASGTQRREASKCTLTLTTYLEQHGPQPAYSMSLNSAVTIMVVCFLLSEWY